jgi:isoleucyl-tRNA synthetase
VLARQDLASRLEGHASLITSELNVHEVRWLKPGQEGEEVRYRLKPNFRTLGPKLGKRVQAAKAALQQADAGQLRAGLVTDGKVSIDVEGQPLELSPEDIEVAVEACEGFAAAGDRVGVVVIHTTLTEQLLDEGIERECQSRIQAVRKELSLDFTARIKVAIDGSERIRRVCEAASARIAKEVLASEIRVGTASFSPTLTREHDLEGEKLIIAIGNA